MRHQFNPIVFHIQGSTAMHSQLTTVRPEIQLIDNYTNNSINSKYTK